MRPASCRSAHRRTSCEPARPVSRQMRGASRPAAEAKSKRPGLEGKSGGVDVSFLACSFGGKSAPLLKGNAIDNGIDQLRETESVLLHGMGNFLHRRPIIHL